MATGADALPGTQAVPRRPSVRDASSHALARSVARPRTATPANPDPSSRDTRPAPKISPRPPRRLQLPGFELAVVMAALLLGIAVAGPAHASAMYTASASAELTLTGITNLDTPGDPSDLFVAGDAFVFSSDEIVAGTATATAAGMVSVVAADPFELVAGEGLSQSSSVSGTAAAGFSFAEHLTDGLLFIDNFSLTDTFLIDFLFDFAVSATAGAGDPILEFAFALAVVDVLSDSGDIDEVFEAFADSEFGPLTDGLTDTIPLSLTIGPDSSDAISLLVDATGLAVAEPVSEPGIFGLFSAGLLALFVAVGRRRLGIHRC